MRNTAKVRFLSLVALLATLALLCASISGYRGDTPQGVQCPTAAVQTLTVAVRDCCDRIVGYEVRAPRSGDGAFMQCRCAEKKVAANHATLSEKFDLFLASREAAPVWAWPERAFVEHSYVAPSGSWSFPPRVRPPAMA